MQSSHPRILIVTGPTAAGKSNLALETASRINGEIINADALQVYDALPILSASPSVAHRKSAPHHLYGYIPPHARHSVGAWRPLAVNIIRNVIARDAIPIIVGGSGMYIERLVHGLPHIPPVNPDVRRRVLAMTPHELLSNLAQLDPPLAKVIPPSNPRRLQRALEVPLSCGIPLSRLRAEHQASHVPLRATRFVLVPSREELALRCAKRFDHMLAHGALDEARRFLNSSIPLSPPSPPSSPVFHTLGLRPLLSHLRGEISLDEAVALAKTHTRRYAKRQVSWIRNKPLGIPDITNLNAFTP